MKASMLWHVLQLWTLPIMAFHKDVFYQGFCCEAYVVNNTNRTPNKCMQPFVTLVLQR